jgi:hypothetical protein
VSPTIGVFFRKSVTVAVAVNIPKAFAVAAVRVIVDGRSATITDDVELTPAYVGPDDSVAE